jgi:hypothetical protein
VSVSRCDRYSCWTKHQRQPCAKDIVASHRLEIENHMCRSSICVWWVFLKMLRSYQPPTCSQKRWHDQNTYCVESKILCLLGSRRNVADIQMAEVLVSHFEALAYILDLRVPTLQVMMAWFDVYIQELQNCLWVVASDTHDSGCRALRIYVWSSIYVWWVVFKMLRPHCPKQPEGICRIQLKKWNWNRTLNLADIT